MILYCRKAWKIIFTLEIHYEYISTDFYYENPIKCKDFNNKNELQRFLLLPKATFMPSGKNFWLPQKKKKKKIDPNINTSSRKVCIFYLYLSCS